MKKLTLEREDPKLEEVNSALTEILPKVKESAINAKRAH